MTLDAHTAHARESQYQDDESGPRTARACAVFEAAASLTRPIALAWLLHQPYPVFPLIGPRHITEARTSLQGLSVELTDDEVAWLTA